MGFLSGLKKFGKGAAKFAVNDALPVAVMFSGVMPPGIGLGLKLASSILTAEQTFPESGSGELKAQFVRSKLASDLPDLLRAAEKARGKEFVDEVAITKALNDQLDATFRLLSLTGLINKEKNVV